MKQDKDSLDHKILNWLEGQGYPLELMVAKTFQEADFSVRSSEFYDDPESQKRREIDVTAFRFSEFEQPVVLQTCFRVECKHAHEKPWIVFVSPAQPKRPLSLLCTRSYQAFVREASKKSSEFQAALESLSLLQPNYVGHGVTQAFTSGQDVSYQAVIGAVKSCIARIVLFEKMSPSGGKHHCCVAFPVVVVDGRLFECSIELAGEMQLNEVESSVLLWKGSSLTYSSPLVHVICKSALSEFVVRVSQEVDVLISNSVEQMTLLHSVAREVEGDQSGGFFF